MNSCMQLMPEDMYLIADLRAEHNVLKAKTARMPQASERGGPPNPSNGGAQQGGLDSVDTRLDTSASTVPHGGTDKIHVGHAFTARSSTQQTMEAAKHAEQRKQEREARLASLTASWDCEVKKVHNEDIDRRSKLTAMAQEASLSKHMDAMQSMLSRSHPHSVA